MRSTRGVRMGRKATGGVVCRLVAAGVLAAGCGADIDDPAADGPTPYIYEPEAPPAPALDAASLSAAVSRALDVAFTLDVATLYDFYSQALPPGDSVGDCPLVVRTQEYGLAGFYWQGECTSETGRSFSGYGQFAEYQMRGEDGVLYGGWQLYHAGRVTAADGGVLDGAGGAGLTTDMGDAPAPYRVDVLDGTFVLSGGAAGTSAWLDGTLQPSLTVVTYGNEETGYYAALVGGVTGIDGPVNTVSFASIEIAQTAAGWPCEREPGGSISVRDTTGNWYDIAFDGATSDDLEVDLAACDGCGEAWYRGTRHTRACVDFSPVFAAAAVATSRPKYAGGGTPEPTVSPSPSPTPTPPATPAVTASATPAEEDRP